MDKINNKNLIVTGIPRSGTTLTTALIDGLSNSVCLSEPAWQARLFKETSNVNELVQQIEKDFVKTRGRITNQELIDDRRHDDGLPLTNYINYDKNGKVSKSKHANQFILHVDNKDFLLGMKHNAHYTSILPHLVENNFFSVLATIRHPIPTILSWQKVNFPISKGRLPGAERFWPEIKKNSDSTDPLLVKQVKIYDLFCERYLSLADNITLLKYETILEHPTVFEDLTNKRYEKEIDITDSNKNKHYQLELVEDIRDQLERYAPHALKLYSLDDY
ncbi:hypothetical protein CWR48_17385 [Oceanobacillus arenosus]|uniref:Sulfotransferase family protein n=1 Tax=Oceanobacillus arenosus TaxID=1229153 RepID=A0A3D8PK05_9BACI|nr:hypothetical protein [Oceanobacillus arenosus]RDW16413.1 hypothetical protein CWR48_17385 [Oceanobacillus arenosus]